MSDEDLKENIKVLEVLVSGFRKSFNHMLIKDGRCCNEVEHQAVRTYNDSLKNLHLLSQELRYREQSKRTHEAKKNSRKLRPFV